MAAYNVNTQLYNPPGESDKADPLGNNGLKSRSMFEQRKYYKEDIYPVGAGVPTPIDLWYNRPQYGRLDNEQNPIIPKESHLTQLANSPDVWALDFVADAFIDFRETFTFLIKKDVEDTIFKTMRPVKGWISPTMAYNVYMEKIYKNFANKYMKDSQRRQKLRNFDDFSKLFHKFMVENAKNFPITFSQFVKSPYCSPNCSGLVIELLSDSHADDLVKWNRVINEPKNCFGCYIQTAQEFGFKVDKNAPWRLIADLKSPAMEKYIMAYPRKPGEFTLIKPPDSYPPFEPPPVPFNFIESPWNVGGVVLWAQVVPSNAQSPSLILRDHTEFLNRRFALGSRPKRVVDGDSTISALDKLKAGAEFHGGGYETPIGKILIIKPTIAQRKAAGTMPQFLTPDNTNYADGNDIAIVEVLHWNGSPTGQITEGYNLEGKDKLIYGKTRNGSIRLTFEIPLDALNLPADATGFEMAQFVQFSSQHIAEQTWERERDYTLQKWEKEVKETHERDVAFYNAKLISYADAQNYYENTATLSFDNLFKRRYLRAQDLDINIIKNIYGRFYHSYASTNPIINVFKTIKCTTSYITKTKIIRRQQIQQTTLEAQYLDRYWVYQYASLRYLETTRRYDVKWVKKFKQKLSGVYNTFGVSGSVEFINKQFKKSG